MSISMKRRKLLIIFAVVLVAVIAATAVMMIVYNRNVTVSFETFGGDHIDNITIKKNSTIEEVPEAEKYGFGFKGWHYDEGLSHPFDPQAKISKSIKLYAEYNPLDSITVSFDTQGGNPIEPIVTFASYSIKPLPAAERENYYFCYWYYSEACTVICPEDNKFFEDTTLYAGYLAPADRADTSAALSDCDPGIEFYISCLENITQSNLYRYIAYNDGGKTASPLLVESAGGNQYKLYAKNGFIPGAFYDIKLLQPGITSFVKTNRADNSDFNQYAGSYSFNVFKENYANINLRSDIVFIGADKVLGMSPGGTVANGQTNNPADDGKEIFRLFVALQNNKIIEDGGIIRLGKGNSESDDDMFYKAVSVETSYDKKTAQLSLITAEEEDVFDSLDVYLLESVDLESLISAEEFATAFKATGNYQKIIDGMNCAANACPELLNYTDGGLQATPLGITIDTDNIGLSVKCYSDYGYNIFDISVTGKIPLKKNGKNFAEVGITFKYKYSVRSVVLIDKHDGIDQKGTLTESYHTLRFEVTFQLKEAEKENDLTGSSKVLSQILDALKDQDFYFSDNETAEMLDQELEYVKIFEAPIFSQTQTIWVGPIPTVSIQVKASFNLSLGLCVAVGAQLDIYSRNFDLVTNYYADYEGGAKYVHKKKIKTEQLLAKSLTGSLELKGQIGIRGGIDLEVNFSWAGLNNLFNVGFGVEIGAYVEIGGLIKWQGPESYTYNKLVDGVWESEQHNSPGYFAGLCFFEIGVYIKVDPLRAKAFGWEYAITVYEGKFPLYNISMGTNLLSGFRDTEVIDVHITDRIFNLFSYEYTLDGEQVSLFDLMFYNMATKAVSYNTEKYEWVILKEQANPYISVSPYTGIVTVSDNAPSRVDCVLTLIPKYPGITDSYVFPPFGNNKSYLQKKINLVFTVDKNVDPTKEYTVKFYNAYGAILSEQVLKAGASPDMSFEYTNGDAVFAQVSGYTIDYRNLWDKPVTAALKDEIYTVKPRLNENKYIITALRVNDQGELEKYVCWEGMVSVLNPEPSIYSFPVPEQLSLKTYTMTSTEKESEGRAIYKIELVYEVKVLQIVFWSLYFPVRYVYVNYGETPELPTDIYPGLLIHETDSYRYIFEGWNKDAGPAYRNEAYSAVYKNELKQPPRFYARFANPGGGYYAETLYLGSLDVSADPALFIWPDEFMYKSYINCMRAEGAEPEEAENSRYYLTYTFEPVEETTISFNDGGLYGMEGKVEFTGSYNPFSSDNATFQVPIPPFYYDEQHEYTFAGWKGLDINGKEARLYVGNRYYYTYQGEFTPVFTIHSAATYRIFFYTDEYRFVSLDFTYGDILTEELLKTKLGIPYKQPTELKRYVFANYGLTLPYVVGEGPETAVWAQTTGSNGIMAVTSTQYNIYVNINFQEAPIRYLVTFNAGGLTFANGKKSITIELDAGTYMRSHVFMDWWPELLIEPDTDPDVRYAIEWDGGEYYLSSDMTHTASLRALPASASPTNPRYYIGCIYWDMEVGYSCEIDVGGDVYTAIFHAGSSYFTFPLDLPAGIYSARIRSLGDGKTCGYSAWISFECISQKLLDTPSLVLDGEKLTWTAVDNASSYILYTNFGTEIPLASSVTQYDLSGITEIGGHWFILKALGDENLYLTSTQSNEVKYYVPGKLPAPSGFYIEPYTFRLEWNSSNVFYYVLEYFKDGMAESVLEDVDVASRFSLGDWESGIYRVRVKAIAESGRGVDDSDWSETIYIRLSQENFICELIASDDVLDTPSGFYIENGILKWTGSTAASGYMLRYGSHMPPDFGYSVETQEVYTNEFDLSGLPSGVYGVEVKALGGTLFGDSLWANMLQIKVRHETSEYLIHEKTGEDLVPSGFSISGSTLHWTELPVSVYTLSYMLDGVPLNFSAQWNEFDLLSFVESGTYEIYISCIDFYGGEYSHVKIIIEISHETSTYHIVT